MLIDFDIFGHNRLIGKDSCEYLQYWNQLKDIKSPMVIWTQIQALGKITF
jgi:hypothetical protein